MEPNIQVNKKIDGVKPKLNRIAIIIITVVALVLVGAVATSVYFYKKSNSNPQEDAVKELASTVKAVGRHLVLPADESPTMATVSDPEKLKDQPFFAKAQKGDKVLIYSNAQKAILYNPTEDKIVEVAPISANQAVPAGN